MSNIFRRVRGVFKRNRPPQQPSPSPKTDPYSRKQTSSRNKRLPDKSDEDDISDDVESEREDRPSRQTELRTQIRGTEPLDEDRLSTAYNSRNTQLRSVSNGVQSGLLDNNNMNTNINSTVNTNVRPTTQTGLPSESQIDDPSSHSPPSNPIPRSSVYGLPSITSPNKTSLPSTGRVPQPAPRRSIALLMNRGRPPIKISPNSTLIGFPPDLTEESYIPPPWLDRPSFPQQQQNRPLPSFRQQYNTSNFEYDYPIKNIVINGNIPSSIANKINRAVEHDRFGNTHHYPYDSRRQHNQRRLTGNSRQYGTRHIREIHTQNNYPQNQIDQTQFIIDCTPQMNYSFEYDLNSFPMPIHHFTACSLPNDPMQCY